MSTPSTLNCGRAETLAEMQQIADAWRDDPDPYKGSVAQMFARAIVAEGMPPGPPRSAAIVQAFGLSGRLDLQQHRIRATLAGVEGRYERREAFRQAFPGLREASDRIIDGRIRRALK